MPRLGRREWARAAGRALAGVLLYSVVALPLEWAWLEYLEKGDAYVRCIAWATFHIRGKTSFPMKPDGFAMCVVLLARSVGVLAGSFLGLLLSACVVLGRPGIRRVGQVRLQWLSFAMALGIALVPLLSASPVPRGVLVSAWCLTWAVAIIRFRGQVSPSAPP